MGSAILCWHQVHISKMTTWIRYLMRSCGRCFLTIQNIHQKTMQEQLISQSHGKSRTKATHAAEKNKDKEPSLFNRDLSHQLTAGGKEALQENAQVAYRESPPCSQLLSFLQKNIISATTAMASILLVAVLVVLMLVMCVRRRQPKFSPAKMTYNIFIMNGKAWWQNSQDKHLKKFTGKQKYPKFNSFV
ncbi:uncharacterized protein C2orf92 homolog isoform X2 [Rattus norvegicus]|uniref:uncharacterized protein C2orf92 homolog isoform X2 n=1 Tax=Rattus norvegicus TaxID=10116 RepID=UPI002FD7C1E8